MKNPWNDLALEPRLDLSRDEIESAFREKGVQAHPDGGGQQGEFEQVREARDILLDPAQRLTSWLVLHGIAAQHSGVISNEVAAMFTHIGEVTTGVDDWSLRGGAITSGLGKALWQKEGMDWKAAIESRQDEVTAWQERLQDRFSKLEAAAASGDFAEAVQTRNELGFLRKWQAELQSRFGKIWEGLV